MAGAEQIQKRIDELRERLHQLGFLIQSCSRHEQRNYESEVRAITAALHYYEALLRRRPDPVVRDRKIYSDPKS